MILGVVEIPSFANVNKVLQCKPVYFDSYIETKSVYIRSPETCRLENTLNKKKKRPHKSYQLILRTQRDHSPGADLGGGCRGCAPPP